METEIEVESKTNQINFIIDSSVLNAFEKCPTLMKYQYVDNLRLKGKKETALEKGDLEHVGLKHYYRAMKETRNWDKAREIGLDKILKYIEAGKVSLSKEDIDDVTMAFIGYVEFYRFERWVPLEVERPFRVVIYEDDDLRVIFQGKIDLIVDTGQISVPVDHKTESRRTEPIELNNQFMAYCYAAKSNNLIVNKIGFQKSLKAEDKFYRRMLSYEDDVLEEWKDETIFKIRELLGYAEINYFPHRYTSCQDKYGKCIFHNVCHIGREARDMKLKSEFVVSEPWNPFKDNED